MPALDKTRSLEDLAAELAELRARGSRVVLCHGVFDLLHIGHIRYLAKAKNLGDVLVVTVTPDRFVSKGPHRPAFPEQLRAEAIASLDCVDYVAINQWPTAGETLALLRPDVYAKGAEFRGNRTPEIVREEAAAAAVGAEMVFIEDITSSSSALINRHLSPFPEEVDRYLIGLAEKYRSDEILRPLHPGRPIRALVVGEAIIDEYYYCQTLDRSSKAPIVAMQYVSHERFCGGAAAVANHLAAFCEDVGLLALVGAQDSEHEWLRGQLRKNVEPLFLFKRDSPTISKRQYREAYFGVPVFEIDVMNDDPLDREEAETLLRLLQGHLGRYDLVVVADYGHAMLAADAVRVLGDAAPFLAVNTQANAGNLGYHTIAKYRRADYVCLAERELRLECRNRLGDLRSMVHEVAGRLGASRMLVTRGGRGSLAHSLDEGFCEAPALASRVVDRVGAGEACLAVTALCAHQQAPLDLLAFLGNVAGAEAVAIVGNREPLDPLAMRRHIESLLK